MFGDDRAADIWVQEFCQDPKAWAWNFHLTEGSLIPPCALWQEQNYWCRSLALSSCLDEEGVLLFSASLDVCSFAWMEADSSPLVSFGSRGLGIFVMKVPKAEEDSGVQHLVLKERETAKSMSVFFISVHCPWIWTLKDKDAGYWPMGSCWDPRIDAEEDAYKVSASGPTGSWDRTLGLMTSSRVPMLPAPSD